MEILGDPGSRKLLHEFGRAAQLDLKHDRPVAVTGENLQVAVDDALELFERIMKLSQPLAPLCECFSHMIVEDRNQDIVFILEVEVDRPVGDTGLARDVSHFGVEESVARKDFYSAAQDGVVFSAAGPGAKLRPIVPGATVAGPAVGGSLAVGPGLIPWPAGPGDRPEARVAPRFLLKASSFGCAHSGSSWRVNECSFILMIIRPNDWPLLAQAII